MELLEGKELIEIIDHHHHISEVDLATIFRQLIQTLYQCHELGFIHRYRVSYLFLFSQQLFFVEI